MKILLSYSKRHYDPSLSPSDHNLRGSSAAILAQTLYEQLATFGEVTYIDRGDFEAVRGEAFDLFVGIEEHFGSIIRACAITTSVLWAVNMHPAERNLGLRTFREVSGLPFAAFAEWDIKDESVGREACALANYILCVGNTQVYNSYVAHGVPKTKLRPINYAVGEPRGWTKRTAQRPRFLYISSEIGMRKGFDILCELFEHLENRGTAFHLDIVGTPTTSFYSQRLAILLDRLDDDATYHGWLPSDSNEYHDVIAAADFLVYPAIEEGQAGSVLDAMRGGVIPLVSNASGIDFSPLGQMEAALGSSHNQTIVETAVDLLPDEIDDLKERTHEYYREFHMPFLQTLALALRACAERQHLYPRLSVILPVFNKETTIKSLLENLHVAALTYENVELIIILDGCSDDSEAVVRRFYNDRTDYKVTLVVTPDIFEVLTNNIGLRAATGDYAVIMQDDVYIYDRSLFLEAIQWLEKDPTIAILGALAGVNYYPRGTIVSGAGQIAMNDNEVYWRQDEATEPQLRHRLFEVDACMRGPLFIRLGFMREFGFLDETYAPFYQDDIDLAFRARSLGYKVYCLLGDVVNKSLTVSGYTEEQFKFWDATIKRNTDTFYARWTPSVTKPYLWVHRVRLHQTDSETRWARRARIREAIIFFFHRVRMAARKKPC